MWPVSKLFSSLIIISCITICSAKNVPDVLIEESPLKMYLVEDIVRKICNISLNTFSNKNPAEKVILLEWIGEKLNNSARQLGTDGEKYVELIMKGVKAKAFESNQTFNYKQATENVAEKSDIGVNNALRTGPEKTPATTNTKSDSKGDLVQNIANKIELLAGEYLNKAKTERNREKVLENIKTKIVKSADRKHATPDEIKAYVDLVSKGIKIVVERDSMKRRRMEFVYTNNINFNKDSQDRVPDLIDPIKPDSLHNNELIKPNSVFLKIDNNTNLEPEFSCDRKTLEETCQKIKMLKTLRCLSDNREFNLMQLCDGVADCLDFSDENDCGHQAVETIQTANRLITYIDTSMNDHDCSSAILDKSMLAKQNKVLSSVLDNQLRFLRKYSESKTSLKTKKVRETIREVVNVVTSLTSALENSLCSTFNTKNLELDEEDLDTVPQKEADQEICKCNGQKCLRMCSPRCESMCFEMYSLSQFKCEAVSGEGLVSLDMVCDGKLDCYDELDEKDCSEELSLAKFEAAHMYDYVLKEIELKTASITFEALRFRLQSLHAMVTKLQKLTMKRQPDVLDIKRVRQACFEELSKIYGSTLTQMNFNQHELFNIRYFLVTLNERLISALKRSSTGNDKIISSNGCVCRANQCALPRCSKACTRACSAEPRLTRFFCNQLSYQMNDSIPLELVCNKKVNCPNGEDEEDCNKDVCRARHLKLLRYNLKDVGKEYEAKSLGEALKSWRIKAKAMLMVAENNGGSSPVVLFDILRDILHDLVMAYAGLEDRPNNDSVFNAFYLVSRIVLDTLKSCRQ